MLTVRQPWASLIVADIKDVENRTWRTHYRGRLLIHAGSNLDRAACKEWHMPDWPKGQIIGCVTLVDCVRDYESEFAMPDHWHWVLDNAVQFTRTRAMAGKLGLWDV